MALNRVLGKGRSRYPRGYAEERDAIAARRVALVSREGIGMESFQSVQPDFV